MAVVFKAGDLRRQMTFQAKSTAKDGYGGQVNSWTDAFIAWCDIQALSGRELIAAKGVNSEVTHTINLRYRSEFDDPKAIAAMRALYKGRIFNIHASMNLEERNRYVQLLASEGLNKG